MTRDLKSTLVVLTSLFVAACGGGGSGASTGIAAAATDSVPSATAPAPAPAGTPTPAPASGGSTSTPAPAPSPSSPAPSPGASPSPAPAPSSGPSASPAMAPAASPGVIANASTTARGVAVLGGGTRVAAWSDGTGVHAQQFDAQGRLVGTALAIAPSGTFTGVAALAGGGYAVEYSQPDAVLVQVVTAGGAAAGAPAVVRTQAQVAADLAGNFNPLLAGGAGVFPLGGGGFAAEYRTSHDAHIPGDYPGTLMVQRYDALGDPVGVPVGLASETPTALATSASTPAGGLVTAMTELCPCFGSGTAQVAVQDGSLQRAGAYAKAPGDQTGSQTAAGLANGNGIAVWTITLPAAGSTSQVNQVQGQVFAPDASTPVGFTAVTPVLTFPNAAAGARVTALARGGFLLAWGGSAQAFDASGQPAGTVMQILDGTIAATPDGGFVVVAQVGSQLVAQQYAVGP